MVTGQPMHVAVGSMAPQNGVGVGLAFVEHKNFTSEWRDSWDVDAQATGNGSWRAGGTMKAFRLAGKTPHAEFSASVGGPHKSGPFFGVSPVFSLYAQATSLQRVDYFGLGPDTMPIAHTTYGFTEEIAGVSAAVPLGGALAHAKLALVAELNGRFPSVRPGRDASLPSIGQLFTEATAPGFAHQAAYVQPSEGLRIDPALFRDSLRLNYLLQFQQFIAPGNSNYSFRRWSGDFNHEIPLYRIMPGTLGKAYYANRAALYPNNGPDDCSGSSAGHNIPAARAASAKIDPARPCPIISTTAKLEGAITLRAFLSESFADRGGSVPFYFSPTIGGSNIDGTSMLSSYPDYRFRGPDLLLFRESLEHSLGKLPVGILFSADEGKIGLSRNDISLDHLRHTFSTGMTIHAGGLPVVNVVFSWGGREGNHTTANISPSLLGGSSRPSLF
jgi:hypothetical protein